MYMYLDALQQQAAGRDAAPGRRSEGGGRGSKGEQQQGHPPAEQGLSHAPVGGVVVVWQSLFVNGNTGFDIDIDIAESRCA